MRTLGRHVTMRLCHGTMRPDAPLPSPLPLPLTLLLASGLAFRLACTRINTRYLRLINMLEFRFINAFYLCHVFYLRNVVASCASAPIFLQCPELRLRGSCRPRAQRGECNG